MPVRRGVRQSKKVVNIDNDDAVVAPASRRGTRRGKAQAPKAVNPMPRAAGRVRGGRGINQDKKVENLDVALRDQLVVGNAEKAVANGEEEGSTSPVPERVILLFLICI